MTQKIKMDVTEKVKQTLLDGLKKDGLQWFKPWKAGLNFPINNASGRAYKGFNNFILNAEMTDKGYEYNEWSTFKSVGASGGKVKKGESGTDVYFWLISYTAMGGSGKWYKTKRECMKAENCSESDIFTNFNLRFYRVWNIAQCTGLTPKRPHEETNKDVQPIESAENIVSVYKKDNPKLDIREVEGDRACYSPLKDIIVMPLMSQFVNADNFYKTLFHEMVHSTGHESRLNRDGVTTAKMLTKSRADYAFEELIAESGAMVLSGVAGICTDCGDDESNSQAYINGWVKAVAKEDAKAVVSALTKSAKAVDYILGE